VPHPAKSRAKVTQTAREVQALTLRIAGANFDQIAEAMGYRTRSAAYKLVESALLKTLQGPADSLRQLELARLDKLLLSLWPQATTLGPHQLVTIDRVLRIMSQRLFYVTGLKVPDKIAPTTPDGLSPYRGEAGLASLLAEARTTVEGFEGETNGHALPSRLPEEIR
jgi:hypothetical protein